VKIPFELVTFAVGLVLGMVSVHLLNHRKIAKLQKDLKRLQAEFLRLIGGA